MEKRETELKIKQKLKELKQRQGLIRYTEWEPYYDMFVKSLTAGYILPDDIFDYIDILTFANVSVSNENESIKFAICLSVLTKLTKEIFANYDDPSLADNLIKIAMENKNELTPKELTLLL